MNAQERIDLAANALLVLTIYFSFLALTLV